MGIKVKGNSVYSIKLFQLGSGDRGFISVEEVNRIKENPSDEKNCAVNINAQVSPIGSDEYDVPVIGTGPDFDDFEIDLSDTSLNQYVSLDDLVVEDGTKWIVFTSKINPDVYSPVVFEESIDDMIDGWVHIKDTNRGDEIKKDIQKKLIIKYNKLAINEVILSKNRCMSAIVNTENEILEVEKLLKDFYDSDEKNRLVMMKQALDIDKLYLSIINDYYQTDHCLDRLPINELNILLKQSILDEDYEKSVDYHDRISKYKKQKKLSK